MPGPSRGTREPCSPHRPICRPSRAPAPDARHGGRGHRTAAPGRGARRGLRRTSTDRRTPRARVPTEPASRGAGGRRRHGVAGRGARPRRRRRAARLTRRRGARPCSAVVITRNEEQRLATCLASLAWADEIVVVDAESTDRTVEIARGFTDRVVVRPWPGFAAQKNFAADQARHEWVLSVDADEEVSAELRAEILRVLTDGGEAAGYALPRRNIFWGRWIRHGGLYPDWQIRLFRRGRGRFVRAGRPRVRRGERSGAAPARPAHPPELRQHRPVPGARQPLLVAGRRRPRAGRGAGRPRRRWCCARSGGSSPCTSCAGGSSTARPGFFWPGSTRTMSSSVRRKSGRERGADGTRARSRPVRDAPQRQGAPGELSRRAGQLGPAARERRLLLLRRRLARAHRPARDRARCPPTRSRWWPTGWAPVSIPSGARSSSSRSSPSTRSCTCSSPWSPR